MWKLRRGLRDLFGEWNIFKKIVLLIVCLLLPVVLLYSYTNGVSVEVIEKELRDSNLKRLSFVTTQMDNIVDQLSILSLIVSKDASVKAFGQKETHREAYQQLRLQEDVVGKLILLSAASSWSNRLTVYFPNVRQALASDGYGIYDEAEASGPLSMQWSYRPDAGGGYFVKRIWEPLLVEKRPGTMESIVEARFPAANLTAMLADFRGDGNANPFFYSPGMEPIAGPQRPEMTSELVAELSARQLGPSGHQVIRLGGEPYLVSYVQSKSLGWYAVEYVPIKQVLSPIIRSRNGFYASIALLLAMGVTVAVVLYRQVQLPIRLLLRGVGKLQSGAFSHRLHYRPNNEFDYLFAKFNEMAAEIQRLLEKVYLEKIRFREAKLKQLQSQINPHFLSNSMFFIKNMIEIGDTQAATTMILNLAEYYRYMTNLEHTMTTLAEELKLIENYLTIQNLRMERFHYELDIPPSMLKLRIPRLMIQPIVENAIVHAVEKTGRYGIIRISGLVGPDGFRITVDDNGNGMSEQELAALRRTMTLPLGQETGCGLWNVHQRLNFQFDERSGLSFSPSPLGGLRVAIRWSGKAQDERSGEAKSDVEGRGADAATANG